jgi:hypothetical protein
VSPDSNVARLIVANGIAIFGIIAQIGLYNCIARSFGTGDTIMSPDLALPLMRVDINTNSLQINIYANSRC